MDTETTQPIECRLECAGSAGADEQDANSGRNSGCFGQITSGQATADVLLQVRQMLTELVGLKIRYLQNDPTLTKAELARILTVVPYNLDAWDGYVVEREVIYTACKQLNKN